MHLWLGSDDGDVYFCGPRPLMQLLDQLLASLGYPETRRHYEMFGPHVQFHQAIGSVACERCILRDTLPLDTRRMRLTQHSDYALRTLMFLGLQPAGKLATIQEIADTYAISKNHLMKVVGKLASHSYVLSTRGARGGIRLAKPPADIVIGDVLRKMEPADGMVECLRTDNECVITPACVLPRILAQAYKAFLHELDQYRLQDLLPESHQPALIQLLGIDSSDPPDPRRPR